MYDGPVGQGYADLVYRTYEDSKALARFDAGSGRSKIIQCAEHLPDPAGILSQTYSTAHGKTACLIARATWLTGIT